jgi:hypothetical protein
MLLLTGELKRRKWAPVILGSYEFLWTLAGWFASERTKQTRAHAHTHLHTHTHGVVMTSETYILEGRLRITERIAGYVHVLRIN